MPEIKITISPETMERFNRCKPTPEQMDAFKRSALKHLADKLNVQLVTRRIKR